MGDLSLPEGSPTRFSDEEKALLLDTAADALAFAVLRGGVMRTVPGNYPPALRVPAACFVSLHRGGALRGCVGTLEAQIPLVAEVADKAAAAAHDPRFPPVAADELEAIEIEVSVLTRPEPLPADSESEVLRALRPGEHGVILEANDGRATFLPSVWEQVPDPACFLKALKQKAGWPSDAWPPDLRIFTYEAERISGV